MCVQQRDGHALRLHFTPALGTDSWPDWPAVASFAGINAWPDLMNVYVSKYFASHILEI